MAEVLRALAERHGDRVALVDERGRTSWTALDERVNRLVHALRAAGLQAGDTFALVARNSREYFEVYLAAAHAGMMYVPVNWHWTADELAYVLDDSDAKAVVADAMFAPMVLDAVGRAQGAGRLLAKVAVLGDIEGFTPYETFVAAGSADEPTDQQVGGPMFYTSGTTGRPKGVRTGTAGAGLPAGLLSLMGAGFSQMLGVPVDGVCLLCGPVYHSAQWAFSLFPLLNGSTVVIRHGFDAADVLRTIDDEGVTNVHLVPTQFVRLLKLPDDVRASFDGSSLQVVWHGAAPCPPDVKRRMIEWWGPKITEYYGGTEGAIISVISAAEWLERPGSVGRPIAPVEVLVVGEDGERLGPNQVGTLYLKGTMGSSFQYHKDPEKTSKAFLEPGVFTLGDVGELDDDGYLWLRDRKIDMIISGGVNIYPAEIEGVLVEHPSVRDAAVFGVPDEEFGEQVKAAVELVDGAAPSDALAADIIAFVRSRLAGYKAPRSVDFEAALPRTPTGKLYKRLLRDRYWADAGRTI